MVDLEDHPNAKGRSSTARIVRDEPHPRRGRMLHSTSCNGDATVRRAIIAAVRQRQTPSREALRWFARGLASGDVSDAQIGGGLHFENKDRGGAEVFGLLVEKGVVAGRERRRE